MEIKGGKGGIYGDIQRDGGGEMEIEVERLRRKKLIGERQRGQKKSEEFHSYLICFCFSSAVCGQK